MKKNVLIFGSIAGLVLMLTMVISCFIWTDDPQFGSMLLGYSSMIVAFSIIFVAIKNIRDKYNNGFISFGKAFKTGLYITIIGSAFYVLTWAVEFYVVAPNFIARQTKVVFSKGKVSAIEKAKLETQKAELTYLNKAYNNPMVFVGYTLIEVFPVGILVSLIAAAILRRKTDKSKTAIAT